MNTKSKWIMLAFAALLLASSGTMGTGVKAAAIVPSVSEPLSSHTPNAWAPPSGPCRVGRYFTC